MKNAKALHAIQISCRTDVIGFIGDIMMAKDAWETLAKRLKPKNRSRDNYVHWSFWVKTYLQAEDLWEVVEGTREAPKLEDGEAIFMAWRKYNARALHVITLFCGDDAESCVRDGEMAKDAWNTLAKKFNPPEVLETLAAEVNSEADSNDDTSSNDGSKVFNEMVQDRRWEAVREFIKQHPEAARAKVGWAGMTPLQYAAWLEIVDGVKELLPLMKKKDMDVLDENGYTALSLAIQNSDTDAAIEMVKNVVEAGEMSMKETATSSSALVAALIITIMFAAAVTVPGGINGDTGTPIYLHTKAFRTFIVADVISLCSSTTSVMVLLGILTYVSPKKIFSHPYLEN
ncbi:hypothetical protein ACLB2K_066750 [Fragaria x ananassa]